MNIQKAEYVQTEEKDYLNMMQDNVTDNEIYVTNINVTNTNTEYDKV